MASDAPMFTIDFVFSLLSPLIYPLPSLFAPLMHLALNADLYSRVLHYLLLYPLFTVLLQGLLYINERVAGGRPRPLDWSSEVVLITGGAGGLGKTVAETCAIRGLDVAVLDVLDDTEERRQVFEAMGGGVKYFQCDVGDWVSVLGVKQKILNDVSAFYLFCRGPGVIPPLPRRLRCYNPCCEILDCML